MKIVNGYVCRSSCDERVARQGRDPRNPHADPVRQRQLDEAGAVTGDPPKDHRRVEPVSEAASAAAAGRGWIADVKA